MVGKNLRSQSCFLNRSKILRAYKTKQNIVKVPKVSSSHPHGWDNVYQILRYIMAVKTPSEQRKKTCQKTTIAGDSDMAVEHQDIKK